MICPACGASLVSKKFHDEVVEKCSACGGLWFDSDELLRVQQCLDDSIEWPDSLLNYGEKLEEKAGREVACPKDGAALVSVHYGPSAVVVDICPECSGVWFDHGEFAKIARDLADASVDKTSVEYLRDMAHEMADLFTGEKGMAEEVKDISETWHLFKNRLAIDHPFLKNFILGLGRSFA